MAGIYIHIPFCKSRCRYCDFYSTTRLERRKDYVDALLREIDIRQEEIQAQPIQTIYFGGGTPSMLDVADVERLLARCLQKETIEVTLEANPQDLTLEKLQAYLAMGINRLSIGIQSFQDKHLKLLGRRHSAQEAIAAVKMAQEAGFTNISIDLIYGIPEQTMEEWQDDVQQALALNIQHLSTYNLIYEEGTALTTMLEQGRIHLADEDIENEMYEYIVKCLKNNEFIHYEVSNFSKQYCYSQHNSSYWNNTPYIGLGAGAHSFMGNKKQEARNKKQESRIRTWNVSDLDAYISSIEKGILPQESEKLSIEDRYNEAIMLGLRTMWGVNLQTITQTEREHCLQQAEKYIQANLLTIENGHLIATLKGTEILNRIIEDLML